MEQANYKNRYIDKRSQRLNEQPAVNDGVKRTVKEIGFTRYEYMMSGVILLLVLGLTLLNLTLINTNAQVNRAIKELNDETRRFQETRERVINDMNIQYSYEEVKAAAEAHGLSVRPGSVKDLTQE